MRVTLTRRWAVPAVAAATLSAGAAYAYARYAAEQRGIHEWLSARPGLTRVDLSRPGAVVVPIPRSPGVHHHGLTIYLDLGDGVTPGGADRLTGLRGNVQVTDDKGQVTSRSPLGEGMESDSASPNRYRVGFTGSQPSDGYTMAITVKAGSPDLAGVESTVYARYSICELEAVPAMLWGLLAGMVGVPAAILWVVTAMRLKAWSASRVTAETTQS